MMKHVKLWDNTQNEWCMYHTHFHLGLGLGLGSCMCVLSLHHSKLLSTLPSVKGWSLIVYDQQLVRKSTFSVVQKVGKIYIYSILWRVGKGPNMRPTNGH
jgi:hypothetical protein